MPTPALSDRRPRAAWLWVGAVSVASLLLGVLTFYAQGFLPDAWRSFANSARGWTLLTVCWSSGHVLLRGWRPCSAA